MPEMICGRLVLDGTVIERWETAPDGAWRLGEVTTVDYARRRLGLPADSTPAEVMTACTCSMLRQAAAEARHAD